MPLPGFILIALLALLTGCAGSPQPIVGQLPVTLPPSQVTADNRIHNDVVFRAISLVGTPYRFGGSSPDTGFDCSGLINYVYREAAGVQLPRTTSGLTALPAPGRAGRTLQPGDLVLFAMSGRAVDHAGIYVGDGRFLHAPSSGGRVRMDNLHAAHWQKTYQGSRRILD